MKKLTVIAVVLVTGCGGGNNGVSNEDLNNGTDLSNDDRSDGYYSDVRGFNVPPDKERLKIGDWPSQLHEGEVVPACSEGDVFYADQCWESLEVNVDKQSVTFYGKTGDTETIAIGAPIPSVLQPLVLRDEFDGTSIFSQHHIDTGYVRQTSGSCTNRSYSDDLWGGMAPPSGKLYGTKLNPWATGFCYESKDNLLTAFAVRTTFLYGFQINENTSEMSIVHRWNYRGHLTVNGKTLAFPIHIKDITEATGVEPSYLLIQPHIDLEGRTIRFNSDLETINARVRWGDGFNDQDLVTDVEFHVIRPLPPGSM